MGIYPDQSGGNKRYKIVRTLLAVFNEQKKQYISLRADHRVDVYGSEISQGSANLWRSSNEISIW